ncbi:Glucanase inhibitor protein [Phytophthora cinnamomi]|uniref:Glucanase inhibitor protein n=1 Tax=Phytophthora cinnamomi TaxID=4785 RepID=UPI00355A1850|nr:Glucanase inhibitor protein [Phytophthora cinnamomi]
MKVISTLVYASVLVGSVSAILGGQKLLRRRSDLTHPRAHTCTKASSANFVSVGAHYINGGEDGDEIKVIKADPHPNINKDS